MRIKLCTVIPAVLVLFFLAGCSRELYGKDASKEIERRLRQKYDIEMSVEEAVTKTYKRDIGRRAEYGTASRKLHLKNQADAGREQKWRV